MKLIALDMDGTTLNSNREISKENIQAIQKAQEQGHIVTIMSGRDITSIKETLEPTGLNCPIGSNNGTALYANEKMIDSISLSQSQSRQIIIELEKESMPYNMTTDKGLFGLENWKERIEKTLISGRVPNEYLVNQYFEQFTTSPASRGYTIVENLEEVLNDKDIAVFKYFIIALDPEQKERIRKKFESIDGVAITSSSPFNLELIHENGNKGNGLKRMAQHFNIPLEDTVAIGDERNDLPMFEMAGLSVAMGNAEDEIKEVCDVVTLTNDENGVAHAIEKYVLKN